MDYVTTIITLSIHLNIQLKRGANTLEMFMAVLRSLSMHCRRCSWARQIEDPCTCWVISEWSSHSDVETFFNSSESTSGFLGPLGSLFGRSINATILHCQLDPPWLLLDGWAEVLLSYFPVTLSEKGSKVICELRDIHPECSWTTAHPPDLQAFFSESKGWALDQTPWLGCDRRVFDVLREWLDEDKERLHKASEGFRIGKERLLFVEEFEEQLRQRSMLGLESKHGHFVAIEPQIPLILSEWSLIIDTEKRRKNDLSC